MARSCHFCQAFVSDQAPNCWKCGRKLAPLPKKRGFFWRSFGVALTLTMLPLFLMACLMSVTVSHETVDRQGKVQVRVEKSPALVQDKNRILTVSFFGTLVGAGLIVLTRKRRERRRPSAPVEPASRPSPQYTLRKEV